METYSVIIIAAVNINICHTLNSLSKKKIKNDVHQSTDHRTEVNDIMAKQKDHKKLEMKKNQSRYSFLNRAAQTQLNVADTWKGAGP